MSKIQSLASGLGCKSWDQEQQQAAGAQIWGRGWTPFKDHSVVVKSTGALSIMMSSGREEGEILQVEDVREPSGKLLRKAELREARW